jgi:outer membrane immunogenic protein
MRTERTARIGAIAALTLGLAGASAQAADMPPVAAPPVKAPVMVRTTNWYGFYIGVHAGYGWGSEAVNYAPNGVVPVAAIPGPVADDPRGFLGGVTYGSNWQFGNLVIGTESDFAFTDISRRETLAPLAGFTVGVTGEQRIKYLSTTRARAGFVLGDNVLVFGTGGLASGSVEGSSSFNLVAPAACAGVGNCLVGGRDKTLWGWAAGGGIEFAQGPWSVKVDYLHYDLGRLKYSVVDPTAPAAVITASTKFRGDLIRGGINYRFNWTLLDLVFGRR